MSKTPYTFQGTEGVIEIIYEPRNIRMSYMGAVSYYTSWAHVTKRMLALGVKLDYDQNDIICGLEGMFLFEKGI